MNPQSTIQPISIATGIFFSKNKNKKQKKQKTKNKKTACPLFPRRTNALGILFDCETLFDFFK